MSDKAQIFLRYDITYKDETENSKRYRGVISNEYSGFDPLGMITRPVIGLDYFLSDMPRLKYITGLDSRRYEKQRRMFDVDFYRFGMSISDDNLKSAIEYKFIEKNDDTRWSFSDIITFVDADFGRLFIDISGEFPDNVKIKYGYEASDNRLNENDELTYRVCSMREYFKDYENGYTDDRDKELIEKVFCDFGILCEKYHIELMTDEDYKDIDNTDYEEFLSEFIRCSVPEINP